MCNSKMKPDHARPLVEIHGRPVLQPASNRIISPEADRQLKKSFKKSITLPAPCNKNGPISVSSNPDRSSTIAALHDPLSPPVSPTSKLIDAELNAEPVSPPEIVPKSMARGARKKVMNSSNSFNLFVLSRDRAPAGSIAAAHREQAVLMQAQRKMRTAHYGRTAAKLEGKVSPVDTISGNVTGAQEEIKRCSFITPTSDPLYVAYHDEEWGVPVHDDKMLFELLVLSGAQVGLDWTSILKKRNDFREAFSGFDVETVAKYSERQIATISSKYGLDSTRIRGVVNNASRISEVRLEFGSLDNYLWGFVNHKPIDPSYKCCRKIPAKTSKSDSISKDMVRRGFRLVGPTVVHSFMQAAGLTNDHLVSCPRRRAAAATAAL